MGDKCEIDRYCADVIFKTLVTWHLDTHVAFDPFPEVSEMSLIDTTWRGTVKGKQFIEGQTIISCDS